MSRTAALLLVASGLLLVLGLPGDGSRAEDGPSGPASPPRGRPGPEAPDPEGSEGTQDAVDRGLDWLKRHQHPDGSWDCDGFEEQCTLGKCGGKGQALFDPGVSGLALLAFLGAGQTHKAGSYQETVKRGLKYLKQNQDPEGCIGPRTSHQFVYNHAPAALAMVEAYALTGSPLFKHSGQRAVDFIERCRNPDMAWRYGVRPGDDDTSVTAWMVSALASAREAGLRVPDEAFGGARAWLEKVTDPETGHVGYNRRGSGPARLVEAMETWPPEKSESMTAAGILTRIWAREDPRGSDVIRKGVARCLNHVPRWDPEAGTIDLYYWYYGSLALFQVGGDSWKTWNAAMKPALVDHQRKDGDAKGSWDPAGPWGAHGGRIYSTAVGVMCLEVYYRYSRVFGVR